MKPTIYIHHDAYNTSGRHLHLVNTQHKQEGYPKSAYGYYTFYQWFIESDGTVINTRPNMDPSVVYKKAHENSISISLAGNFNRTFPTEEQLAALDNLLNTFAAQYGIDATNIKEHRYYQSTYCPGTNIPHNYFAYRFIGQTLNGLSKVVAKLKQLMLQLGEN